MTEDTKRINRIAAALDYLIGREFTDRIKEEGKIWDWQWEEAFEVCGRAPSYDEGYSDQLLRQDFLEAEARHHFAQQSIGFWISLGIDR